MSNPSDNGPFWPLIFFPLTAQGRRRLADIFGITTIKNGVRLLRGEEPDLFGEDLPPTKAVNCYACGHDVARNGYCLGCGTKFAAYIRCPVCSQRQGVADGSYFSFICGGCKTHVVNK